MHLNSKNTKIVVEEIQKIEKSLAILKKQLSLTDRDVSVSQDLETIFGVFDGKDFVSDSGKIYPVPGNYASKSKLVAGDKMTMYFNDEDSIYKVVEGVERRNLRAIFDESEEGFWGVVDDLDEPIELLEASCLYSMKYLGVEDGDEISVLVPADGPFNYGILLGPWEGEEDFSLERLKVKTRENYYEKESRNDDFSTKSSQKKDFDEEPNDLEFSDDYF